MVLQSISVGIDGSDAARAACGWAAMLAEKTDAEMRVLHVWQSPSVCIYPAAPTPQDAENHARSIVRATLEETGSTRNVESVLLRGAAGPALIEGSKDTDLLVVGRAGDALVEYQPRFGELIGGSAARYCARHSTVAVAAVNEGATWVNAPQVVVGVDGSPASLAALEWATGQLPADATIHAVRAVALPDAELGAPVDYELLDPVVEKERAELQRLVDAHTDASFDASGRTVQIHVVVGYARDGLLEPGFHSDLIVVGEHANAAETGAPLGSVADHTLREAMVPIVIVHAPRQ